MGFLYKNKSITNYDIQKLFNIKMRMARNISQKLTEENILIKKGAARATHYVLNKQGKDEQ